MKPENQLPVIVLIVVAVITIAALIVLANTDTASC